MAIKKTIKKILNDLDSDFLPEKASSFELSLLITDNAEIAELNSTYRSKEGPTDVLSFPAFKPGTETDYAPENMPFALGDIIISLEKAGVQAKQRALSVEEEVLRLLIHGVLHLFGYDHEKVTEEEKKVMQDLEDELCERYIRESEEFIELGDRRSS